MKTCNIFRPLLLVVLTFICVNAAYPQTAVNSSGSSIDNVLTKWVGTDGDEITNSQVYDNGTAVGIGTVVPVSKLHVQNGNTYDPSTIISEIGDMGGGSVTGANIGVVVTSHTGTGFNVGTLNIATDDEGVNIGTASTARGDGADLNVGVIGNAIGVGSFNIGVAGIIEGEGAAVIANASIINEFTIAEVFAFNGAVEVEHANTTIEQAFGLNIGWNNAGTIDVGYGIVIGDIEAEQEYGFVQQGPDDLNYFSGKLGISTTNPGFELDVVGTSKTDYLRVSQGADAGYVLQSTNTDGDAEWVDPATLFQSYWTQASGSLYPTTIANNVGIGTTSPRQKLDVNGKVVIGTETITSGSHTDFMLSVDGKVVAKEYIATLNDWADFVFSPEYKLRPIAEVENFIKTNGHLPDVPSASEVSAQGVNMAEMNATLLQKIEELTLYIIEQNKRIEQLESQK